MAAALLARLDRRAGGAGAGAVAGACAIGSTCSEVEVCVSNVYLNARLNWPSSAWCNLTPTPTSVGDSAIVLAVQIVVALRTLVALGTQLGVSSIHVAGGRLGGGAAGGDGSANLTRRLPAGRLGGGAAAKEEDAPNSIYYALTAPSK